MNNTAFKITITTKSSYPFEGKERKIRELKFIFFPFTIDDMDVHAARVGVARRACVQAGVSLDRLLD